jgi:hypothetical protein
MSRFEESECHITYLTGIEDELFEVHKPFVINYTSYKAGDYVWIRPIGENPWHIGKIEKVLARDMNQLFIGYFMPQTEDKFTKCDSQWIKVTKVVKERELFVVDHSSIYRKLTVMEWDEDWLYIVSGLV